MELTHHWHQKSSEEVLQVHGTTQGRGLKNEEIEQRISQFGPNKLESRKPKSAWKIFLQQFSDVLVLVLLGAAGIAFFLGDPEDTIAIFAIVILNAVLGFYQEFRAEKAMEALKALSAPMAKVRRAGHVQLVAANELVPGDIVLLEAGYVVPADLRMIASFEMSIDESALTGESMPVPKGVVAIDENHVAIAEQKNMAFKGTVVATGRGEGVVVRTGMATELGRIAGLLKDEVEVSTPLQRRMARFAKGLSGIVIGLCLVIFIIGWLKGEEPVLMFMTSLSLAVAAIPEALPAVITVALALGARMMSRQNALIRKLSAVETLGSVTYICSDKTGTLTKNSMEAKAFVLNNNRNGSLPDTWEIGDTVDWTMRILTLNNDVTIDAKGYLEGDPTEVALAAAAKKRGKIRSEMESLYPRIHEFPFSSERGMMTTIHQGEQGFFAILKGAPEKVLERCESQLGPQGLISLDSRNVELSIQELAADGFRVLALAYRQLNQIGAEIRAEDVERSMTFVGLIGLIDPPREEAKEAIRLCMSSGIHVVMITGDHPKTAQAIAKQLGIIRHDRDRTVSGTELFAMKDEELKGLIHGIKVYARVAPEQKIRIVKALQDSNEIVAMTGDGVNDAPALKRADIGVSMGKGGTDVAREASHMVLLDDNFASIVHAVGEGRRIYDNIRKFVRFALSGNSGEIWTLFLAPFLGLPIPLLPIHILWVNLVTDGLPGLALAAEPPEKNIMSRPPRSPKESIFANGLWQHTLWVGLLTAATTLGLLAWAYHTGHAHWQSMAFTVLTFVQMGHVLAIRSERESFFRLGIFSNLPLMGAVLSTFFLQLATLYVPSFQKVFKTEPLSIEELGLCFLASTSVFVAVEIEKWWRRRAEIVLRRSID